MAMDINDYSRLLDTLENERGSGEFLSGRSAHVTHVVGSGPSAAKARLYGTGGKLGVNGPIGNTASEYTARISRSAESQAIGSASRSIAVSDFMASIGMVG